MKSSLKCHMSHSIDCDYEVCQNHHKFLANFSVSLNLSNCLQVNIMNSTDIIVNTTIATTTYDTSVLIEFASPSQTTPMTKNITSTTTILPLISSVAPTLGQRLICPKNQKTKLQSIWNLRYFFKEIWFFTSKM